MREHPREVLAAVSLLSASTRILNSTSASIYRPEKRFQDVFKMFSRCFKMFLRCFQDVSRYFRDVFKMFQDVSRLPPLDIDLAMRVRARIGVCRLVCDNPALGCMVVAITEDTQS